MKRFLSLLVFALIFWTSVPAATANEDAEGCKDSPTLSRMPNFFLDGCENNFDGVEFYSGEDVSTIIEGNKTVLHYWIMENADGEARPAPSPLQIKRNYENALKSLGGAKVYENEDYLCAKITKPGSETWVSVAVGNGGETYTLTIVNVEKMVQEVTANQMLDALNKDGFISLYINFDTGKSDIKPESRPALEEIAALLRENVALKISVEGHTDNVGTPEANKKLSGQRAKSVMDAVIAKGISPERMTSTGWGQERPIADNRSEDGRAKNRRVEIVKK